MFLHSGDISLILQLFFPYHRYRVGSKFNPHGHNYVRYVRGDRVTKESITTVHATHTSSVDAPATRHFNPKVSATHRNKDQFEVLQLLSRTSSIEMVRRPGDLRIWSFELDAARILPNRSMHGCAIINSGSVPHTSPEVSRAGRAGLNGHFPD